MRNGAGGTRRVIARQVGALLGAQQRCLVRIAWASSRSDVRAGDLFLRSFNWARWQLGIPLPVDGSRLLGGLARSAPLEDRLDRGEQWPRLLGRVARSGDRRGSAASAESLRRHLPETPSPGWKERGFGVPAHASATNWWSGACRRSSDIPDPWHCRRRPVQSEAVRNEWRSRRPRRRLGDSPRTS